MKHIPVIRTLLSLCLALFLIDARSQGDDIYYNPDTDADYFGWHNGGTRHDPDKYYDEVWRDQSGSGQFEKGEVFFDDRDYTYFDDYAYHYSSRIRRFHRPVYGAGFFDPFYVNMGFYDPFLMNPFASNVSIYVGFNQFGWNAFNPMSRWNRWNRWNSWDPFFGGGWSGMGPGGWNNWGGGFGNTFFINNYYGDPWFGNPYFSNAFCPPTHWVNTGGFTGNVDTREVYYGPRKTRSGVAPNSGVVSRSGDGGTQSGLREARLRDGRNNTGTAPGQSTRQSTLDWGDERPAASQPDRKVGRDARSSDRIRMSDVPRTGARSQRPEAKPDVRYRRPTERPSASPQRSTSPSRSSRMSPPTRRPAPSRSSGSSSSSGGNSSGRSTSTPSSGGSSRPSSRRGGGE